MIRHSVISQSLLAIVVLFCPMVGIAAGAPKVSKFKDIVKKAEGKDSTDLRTDLADAKRFDGMFNAYLNKKGDLYFELADSVFGRDYLLVNRVKSVSQTSDFVAGQMCGSPMIIRFTKDDYKVYLHLVQTSNTIDPDDPIMASYDRNFVDPVLKGFKIEYSDSAGTFIDVTKFFAANEKAISPIKETNPISKMLGAKDGIKGTFYADGSGVSSVKAFPKNVEVESMLAFTTPTATRPYTVVMSRSIVELPETPMRPRMQDNRVGYFYDLKNLYTSKEDRLRQYTTINRHRLEPRPEDMEAYFAGELVEPQKKIVFYVDSAFPEKWRGAVKEGIEYWNVAFEAAGFKNAVEARDYPTDDPDFDPDDIRYSCVRYCVTPTANAMGPSYTDPRSGEILGADVIWYHNILSLVHDWRFTQTAAVDPRVRTKVFADSVMNESLTYVAAHEIGHCLGLMHNMGASHSFTIDNLRDPEFTQRYGTTPSIMDYARNNYVAQPGDRERGVRLTPPPVGVYDIYAINWGYRIIPGAETMEDERPVLDAWIREKEGDKMYEFGAQQMLGLVDPTDQTEDLSNDHIAAGDLAVSNLKIIMENFEDWAGDKDATYEPLAETYDAMVRQYLRHVGHVYPYIGGIVFKEIRQGHPDGNSRNFIDKKQTKAAMDWLLGQARSNDWLAPAELMLKWEEPLQWQDKMRRNVVGCLLSAANLQRIKEGGKANPAECYQLEDYMDDALHGIFAATYAGRPLNDAERTMQTAAVNAMTKYAGLQAAKASSSKSKALSAVEEFEAMQLQTDDSFSWCSTGFGNHAFGEDDYSFFRLCLTFQSPLPDAELKPLMLSRLRDVLKLYKSKRSGGGDRATRDFYEYQIFTIEEMLGQ